MSAPLLYGILVALIWGVQPVVSRHGFQLGLSAQDATLVRYLVSGLLMLPYVCKRGLADACGIGWHRALLLFLLSGPMFSLILIGGVNFAPASHGALISRFVLKHPERFSLFGMLLLLGGLGLIGVDSLQSPDPVTLAGALPYLALFGMAASALALGEPLHGTILAGALSIVAGLVLSLHVALAPHHQDKVR